MPDLDVSDLFFDNDLCDIFSVLRRQQSVNNFGEVGERNYAFTNLMGAIYPAGDNSIVKQEAYQTQSAAITVVTTFRLRGVEVTIDGKQSLPDIVVWQNRHYEVKDINNYSRYGGGFVEATCVNVDLAVYTTPIDNFDSGDTTV